MPPKKGEVLDKKEEKKRKAKEKKEKAAAERQAEVAKLFKSMEALNLAGSGKCYRSGCTCPYFIPGHNKRECYGCFHSRIYHSKTRMERILDESSHPNTRPQTAAVGMTTLSNMEIPPRPQTSQPMIVTRPSVTPNALIAAGPAAEIPFGADPEVRTLIQN
jgi:hypothetical protein